MPTYEYECTKCGHVFEEFQAITDKPRSRCPRCRGKVQKLISGGLGIVFKGDGFYVNDSRKGRKSTAPASTDGGGSPSATGDAAPSGSGSKAAKGDAGTASPSAESPSGSHNGKSDAA